MDIITIHSNIKKIAIERDWCKNSTHAPVSRTDTTKTITFKLKYMNGNFVNLVNWNGTIKSLQYLKEIILHIHPELKNSGYQICLTYRMASYYETNSDNFLKL